MVYKSEGGERNWSLPSGELHQLLIGYQKQLISECLFLLLWSRWSLSVTLAGGSGVLLRASLLRTVASLLIIKMYLPVRPVKPVKAVVTTHCVNASLLSHHPHTGILFWNDIHQQQEVKFLITCETFQEKVIIHGYFQNKSQLAEVLNCFCPTGSWVSCFTSTTYVIFDSSSFSGGFLFWWHLVAASVVLIGPETLQEVTKRKNWDMLLVL